MKIKKDRDRSPQSRILGSVSRSVASLTHRMVFGFCFAGILGFIAEFSLIQIGIYLEFGAIIPRFISLPTAILITFLANRSITFSNCTPITGREIISYYITMLLGAAFSLGLYSVLVFMNVSVKTCLVVATICTGLFNFVMSRKLMASKQGRSK